MTASTAFPDSAPKQFPVDENVFLKKLIDVSSPEEKKLDDELLKPPAKQFPFPASKVENINGSLKITSDGRPVQMLFRSCSATTLPGAPVERMMRENGIETFMVDIDFHSNLSEVENHAFKMFKTRADNILKSVPDAKFIVRVWMMKIGDDFIEKHPASLLAGPNGETKCDDLFKRYGKYYYPNMLGDWKRWNGQYLRSFLELLGNSEYASKTMGCYIGAMNTGEWWYYKPTPFVWDYSETRKKAFSNFLKLKYGNNLKNLSGLALPGYSERNLTELPSPEERNKRSVTPCSKVSDYNQLMNLPITEAAIFFGKIIKTMSGNRMLAGFEIHAGIECFPINGTVFISQLLESEYVDFLGGPAEYPHRGPGNSPWFRLADGSLKKHGKLWFNEGDYRFHSAYGTKTGVLGESTLSPEETINVMRREFARMIIKNYYTYLMDFQWYWFFDRKLFKELGRLEAIQRFTEKSGIKRNPQIALVTDQESQLYSNYYANPSHMIRIFNDKLGCDSEYFELGDFLETKNKENFKMIIFLNARALSDRERTEIEKLKTNNRVIVWMHDPGMINLSRMNSNISEDLKKLTGIEVKAEDKDLKEKILIDKNEYLKVIKNNRRLSFAYEGPENNVIQARMNKEVCIPDCSEGSYVGNVLKDVECTDRNAVKLGSDSSGKCRFAMKKFPSWTSVYIASCLIDPVIIKDFAELAGCHIYMKSDDILFASEKILAVHAVTSGKKTISLPVKSGVYEVFDRQIISENTDVFDITMNFGETKLFFLGNPSSVKEEIAELYENISIRNQEFIKKYPAPDVALANSEFCRSQSPEKFFSLGSRKKLFSTDIPKSEFPIIDLCPSAFLFAGPFSNDEVTKNKIKDIMKDLQAKPELLKEKAGTEKDLFKINRKADSFLQSLNKIELQAPDLKDIHWKALSCPLPWIYDYDLGMKEKQLVLITFFLKGKPGDKSEILFISDGDAELLFNGKPLSESGINGNRGTIIEHSAKSDIIAIMFSNKNNPVGESGFSFKVFRPDPALKPGEQIQKHTENVSVKLIND